MGNRTHPFALVEYKDTLTLLSAWALKTREKKIRTVTEKDVALKMSSTLD